MVFSGFTMKMVVLTEKHGDLATKKSAGFSDGDF
jgi:hypothetical protein